MEEIVNRVANSGIITLDFEEKLDVIIRIKKIMNFLLPFMIIVYLDFC